MNKTDNFTGPLNLGNDSELSILDIAEKIIKLSNSKSSIKHLDSLPDDPIQRRPDLSLASKMIGWNPSTKLEEGILSTIEYFKTII